MKNKITAFPYGKVRAGERIMLQSRPYATIYYTTDDSDPLTSGTAMKYSTPFLAGSYRLRAIAQDDDGHNGGIFEFAYELDTASYISVKEFGAVGDGVADDTSPLISAISYAQKHNLAVYIPEGEYRQLEVVEWSGIHVFGDGERSIIRADHPEKQAFRLIGSGSSLCDVKLTSSSEKRLTGRDHQRLGTRSANHFIIERTIVENSSASGIFIYESTNGIIRNNTVIGTKADGIHNTNRSCNLLIEYNRVLETGDDLIAVVSYDKDGGPCSNIRIQNNNVQANKNGRGITVVGGEYVTIENNIVTEPFSAAIYIASEDSFKTFGVNHISVIGNTLYKGGHAVMGHGAVHVFANRLSCHGIEFRNNQIVDARSFGAHLNGGQEMSVIFERNSFHGTVDHGIHLSTSFTGTALLRQNDFSQIAGYGVIYCKPNNTSHVEIIHNVFRFRDSNDDIVKKTIYVEAFVGTSVHVERNEIASYMT